MEASPEEAHPLRVPTGTTGLSPGLEFANMQIGFMDTKPGVASYPEYVKAWELARYGPGPTQDEDQEQEAHPEWLIPSEEHKQALKRIRDELEAALPPRDASPAKKRAKPKQQGAEHTLINGAHVTFGDLSQYEPIPARAKTAYSFFSAVVRDQNPGMSFSAINKLCGDQWKALSEEEQQPYHDMSTVEKARVEAEMKAYVDKYDALNSVDDLKLLAQALKGEVTTVARKRSRKKAKEGKGPKKAISEFMFFKMANSEKLRAEKPANAPKNWHLTTVKKMWNALTPEEQQPFTQMAIDDQTRYETESREWKQKQMAKLTALARGKK